MTGEFSLNGYNATKKYGIVITEGSAESLMQFPALYEPQKNEWEDQDGIEVDLSSPALMPREITVKFAAIRQIAYVAAFLKEIAEQGLNEFIIPEIGATRNLRYIKCDKLEGEVFKLRKFEVVFTEDKPLLGYVYSEPTTSLMGNDGYLIGTQGQQGSKALRDYNFITLQGTNESIEKAATKKPALTTKYAGETGQTYDYHASARFSEKYATIAGLIITETAAEFNQKMDALLYDLTRPGARILHRTEKLDLEFYYHSCRVRKIESYRKNGIWCEMDINIVITNQTPANTGGSQPAPGVGVVSNTEDYILSTQDYQFIETQNGLLIDMNIEL